MSTKTNFKRVALVAVAALGLGVLTSVAPASAAVGTGSLTVSASSLGVCASDSGAPLSTIAMSKTGSLIITVASAADSGDTIKTSGVLSITGSDNVGTTISVDQKKLTEDGDGGNITFTPSGAGSATIYTQAAGTGANLQTVNVTVVDSCAGSGTPNAANSYVQVIDASAAGKYQTAANLGTSTLSDYSSFSANVGTEALNTSVDKTTSFANGATAYVNVTARDAYKLPLAGTDYYYGIACTGDVVVNGGTTNGGFIAGVGSKYSAQFKVAQGTLNAGVATTCTVTVNNVVLGTKSITIKGDLAKIEASLRSIGTSGVAAATAGAGTISYKYFDAAGNRLATTDSGLSAPLLTTTGSALINTISSASAVTDYVVLTTKDTTGRVSYGCVGSTKSGDVSLVLKVTNAAGATISANAVTASCGGALDTYTASLDKATYQTGDIATLTIKGLDINGKKVNDFVTADKGAAITVSGMTAVTTPATTDAFYGGALVYTYKVDNTAGNYVASVYLPAAVTQTDAVTVKAVVTSQGGVSNADVLKAIVSLIASINKQIAALQKALLKK
jgi:trimeric autotransporter adhesin